MNQVKLVKISHYRENLEEIFSDLNFRVSPGEKVLIKPNLVMPRSSDSGVTTDLKLISALIEILMEKGAVPVLAEGVGYEFTSQTFSILGLDRLIDKYGIEFVDCRNCPTFFKEIELPEVLKRVDKIINLPKLKTHVLSGFSCGKKNLMGLLPLSERRKMHLKGLEKTIDRLSRIIPVDLTIVDASVIMTGRGPAFGDGVELGLLLAGRDISQVDLEAKKLLKKYSSFEKNRPYLFLYWLVYLFDHFQEKITGRTLIPWIHWHFGARPEIDTGRCLSFPKCRKCLSVCPVKAVSKGKIDFRKCAKIRCLKCFEICPHRAVKIRGFSKPSNG